MATKQTTKADEARAQREAAAAKAEAAKTAEAKERKASRTGKPTELAPPVKVHALPEISRGNGGGGRARSERWVKQLAPVIAEPGAWFMVAKFNATATAGAQSSILRVAARQYAAGETPRVLLPEYDTEKYELQVAKRGLEVYAALVEKAKA